MSRRTVKLAFGALALIVAIVTLVAWRLLRVEDIPEQLEPIDDDPARIVLEGLGEQPDLHFDTLHGRQVFFVFVGAQSAKSREGEAINRALNRWDFPETTVGYIIGDAEGFGLFRDKITTIMLHFAEEVRFPLYVDFEGVFGQTFKLPKGRHALVVLGPDGEVLLRQSGGIEGGDIEKVRALLGATEPAPGPQAPTFSVGSLDDERCQERTCAIAFLGEAVERKDVPGVDGGFRGDDDASFAQMRNPSVRVVRTILPTKLDQAEGIIVGQTSDLEFDSWSTVDEAPDARAAFDLGADETAVVIVDQGRIAFFERGLIPLYRWSTVADLLNIDIDDTRPPKGQD